MRPLPEPKPPSTLVHAPRVRRALDSDLNFIARLGEAAFGEFGYADGAARVWMAEHFCTWVAVRSQPKFGSSTHQPPPTLLGFVVLGPALGERAEISAIAVAAGERGRGVGRLLLDVAEQSARQRGARATVAHTADANLAALQLFLSRGYRIRRRLPGYYGVYAACELLALWPATRAPK